MSAPMADKNTRAESAFDNHVVEDGSEGWTLVTSKFKRNGATRRRGFHHTKHTLHLISNAIISLLGTEARIKPK